uniref:Anaphylatoxin-like domain-containing protein n=1 Tax=Leptobrachium leishanense TaxID=445787 RepID=A0A8C5MVS4_9ANUR
MRCTLLQFALLPLLTGSYAKPLCTLIMPSVLNVENEETIVLDAQGHSSPFDAFIEIQDFPHRKNVLTQAKVSLNSENNYLGMTKLSVPAKDLPQDPKKKQFVYVTVKSSSCPLEKVVHLSFRSGYIFIQTDKSVYTPGSRVLYHMFKMNNMLQPDYRPIMMEFQTPDGTSVRKERALQRSNLGIISQSYMLSDRASVGVWTITAEYEDSPQHIYTTNFEVKEYVLPRFEVSLLPRRKKFHVREDSFDLKIKAQYLYGKPVEGKAFVLFGVKKDGLKRGIPDTLREVPVEQGEGESSMDSTDLLRFFRNDDDMSNFTLHVSVTVITESGSELEEAELENIPIVTSPYKILFNNPAKYFKPGVLFDVTALVTDPDGSPANGIPVVAEPGGVEGTTQEDGTARLKLSTTADMNSLEITVKTADPALPLNHQVSETMTVTAHKTLGGQENFLHIGVTNSEVKLGETVAVNFNVRSGLETQDQIQHFTYMIINKGRIMTVARQPRQAGQTLVTMSLPITEKYIPSFRIVAYYNTQTTAGREIVSDSAWVDVKDTCMGTLELTGEKDKDNEVQTPFSLMRLKVRATHKSVVAFVAVDEGVYALNRKFKISQSKVWDTIEKSTIDCSLEDGTNSQGAFTDAGLTLQTNFTISSVKRSGSPCQASLVQKQRSSMVTGDFKSTHPWNYHGHKRTCCEKGMKERPVGHSCEQSSLLILDGKECADAFLTCCKHFAKEKADEELLKEEDLNGGDSEDDEYMPDEEIQLRSDSQESWLWRVQNMGNKPDNNGISTETLPIFVKDSITMWKVSAVSLSEDKGICVCEPFEIRSMKDFFIDMRLPYSVVRNEEMEIQAVLHNYGSNKLKVRTELAHNPAFCSLSTSKKNFRQEVSVNGLSSAVVSFVVVPLNLGSHDIEVKAAVSGGFVSDGVKKMLKVMPEGKPIFQTIKSLILNPEVKGVGGVQTENILPLDVKNKVPNTDVTTIITIKGSAGNLTLEDAIDGQSIIHMITTAPSGNGEQNIIAMTHSVIATVYLDTTNQWEKIGIERRAEAIKNIRQGYTQQLGYWKADRSFSATISRGSSTWLTAYVAKVFALAEPLVYISHDVPCEAIKWLILERQRPDGSFQETSLVIQQEMMGRIKGSSEPVAALTAFVLIAMLENWIMCEDGISNFKIYTDRAASFLTGQYPTLREPYTVAITSYALAKAGFLDDTKTLMAASTDNSHWLDRDSIVISLEATAYALLALLEMKQYELTGPVVRWLTKQRYYGEGAGSTQATIISFQAQAQYQQVSPIHSDLKLDVQLHVPDRNRAIHYRIEPHNAMLERSIETQQTKEIMVKAAGRGQATLTVSAVYQTLATEEERTCSNFDLSVNVTEVSNVKASSHDRDYTTLALGICFRHLKDLDASMSVVEVSMLPGFIPDVEEFKKLFHGAGNHISRYEIKKETTGIGSLVIYLDKVSHKQEECVKVVAHQIFRVGRIQPASVTVYDYNNPESRCNTFYKRKKGNGQLGRTCQGNVSL